MWIGRDGADLFVWTPADSWKVKRVRNDPRVLLAPSGRFGKVRDDVLPVQGTAQVITDPATVDRLRVRFAESTASGTTWLLWPRRSRPVDASRESSCGSQCHADAFEALRSVRKQASLLLAEFLVGEDSRVAQGRQFT